jgi:hypothetical protein
VEYGTGTTYGRLTTLDSRLVTSHSQVITGLARHSGTTSGSDRAMRPATSRSRATSVSGHGEVRFVH